MKKKSTSLKSAAMAAANVQDVQSKFTESYARQNQMVSLMDKLIAKKGNASLLEKQQSIKK